MHISKNNIKAISISSIFIFATFLIAKILYNTENPDILNSSVGTISSTTATYITNLHIITYMGFAFVAGIAAAFNPCGFVMLPAYIGLYLNKNKNQKTSKKIINALIISLSMTLGFTILFALFAIIISIGAKTIIYSLLPWMGMSIGILLIIIGAFLLSGNSLYTNIINKLGMHKTIQNENNIKTYFMFGLSYGIVSLSCTFPIFLAVIGSTFYSSEIIDKVTQFILYSAGMGFVIIIITLSMTIFKININNKLQYLSVYINKISNWLIILAGSYIIYYWLTYGEILSKIINP